MQTEALASRFAVAARTVAHEYATVAREFVRFNAELRVRHYSVQIHGVDKRMLVRFDTSGHGVLMFSDRRIELAILVRSAWLWLLARLVLALLAIAARADPLVMDAKASLILIAVIGTLSWLDTRGQNEDLLLANLGTSRSMIHALGIGAPLTLETLVTLISRL